MIDNHVIFSLAYLSCFKCNVKDCLHMITTIAVKMCYSHSYVENTKRQSRQLLQHKKSLKQRLWQ